MGKDYDDAANELEIKTALEHYLGSEYSPKIYTSVLTSQRIREIIDNDDPVLMLSRSKKWLSYAHHVVTMIGYEFATNGDVGVRIMDPEEPTDYSKFCTYDVTGNWTFYGVEDGMIFTWFRTIVIK